MSYITPSTYIYVLEGVPFDETYQHSIYFANTTAQYTYFYSKKKYTFDAQTYQRVKRGYCRVQQKADSMYGCNYMMFQNTSYGTKWFYAFILDVEYINDNVSEIHYEIDVLQSWMFPPAQGSTELNSNFSFNKCFVEREHSATDNIGDNLVPEGLELGDYVIDDYGAVAFSGGNLKICIASTKGRDPNDATAIIDVDGQMISGVYSGVRYNWVSDATNANSLLDAIVQASGNDANSTILGIYMIPEVVLTNQSPNSAYSSDKTISKPYTSIDGYTPKNKKLFTYPYQMLCVDNGETIATYNWEYFNVPSYPNNAILTTYATVVGGCQYMIVPQYYKLDQSSQYNMNEALTGNISTQCSYNLDGYKAWLAQNQYSIPAQEEVITRNRGVARRNIMNQYMNGVANSLGGVLGLLETGGGKTPMANTYNTIASAIENQNNTIHSWLDANAQYDNAMTMLQATKDTATLKPHAVYGSEQGGIRMASGMWRPRHYNMHIRREFAEIIDGYFERYGYACHEFKTPSINNRPYWTYVRTVGCSIQGNIPNDDSSKICAIFNAGITFWTSGANVGNYSLNNAPVSSS